MTNTTDVKPIYFTKAYELDREQLFSYLTKPEHLKQWFSPSYFSKREFHGELKIGGTWSMRMEDPSGSIFQIQGGYQEIEAPSKLSFTHSWLFESGNKTTETLVDIELTSTQTGCSMELTHQGFSDQEIRDRHEEGWNDTFDNLDHYLRQ